MAKSETADAKGKGLISWAKRWGAAAMRGGATVAKWGAIVGGVLLLVALAAWGWSAWNDASPEEPVISREQVDHMFARIHRTTNWDTSGDLLWSYYFLDEDTNRLQAVANQLAGEGFSMVSIRRHGNSDAYVLHMERVEAHTPDTLYERNVHLERVARQHRLAYDGMDVGLVPVYVR